MLKKRRCIDTNDVAILQVGQPGYCMLVAVGGGDLVAVAPRSR